MHPADNVFSYENCGCGSSLVDSLHDNGGENGEHGDADSGGVSGSEHSSSLRPSILSSSSLLLLSDLSSFSILPSAETTSTNSQSNATE